MQTCQVREIEAKNPGDRSGFAKVSISYCRHLCNRMGHICADETTRKVFLHSAFILDDFGGFAQSMCLTSYRQTFYILLLWNFRPKQENLVSTLKFEYGSMMQIAAVTDSILIYILSQDFFAIAHLVKGLSVSTDTRMTWKTSSSVQHAACGALSLPFPTRWELQAVLPGQTLTAWEWVDVSVETP